MADAFREEELLSGCDELPDVNQCKRCKALHDFESDNDNDLSFKKDDIIIILEMLEGLGPVWWRGMHEDKSKSQTPGSFPSNYVRIICSQEGASGGGEALSTNASIQNDENFPSSKKRCPELGRALSPKQSPAKRLPEMKVQINSAPHEGFSVLQGVWRTPNSHRASIHGRFLTFAEDKEQLHCKIIKPCGERDQSHFSFMRGGLKWELTSFQETENRKELTWKETLSDKSVLWTQETHKRERKGTWGNFVQKGKNLMNASAKLKDLEVQNIQYRHLMARQQEAEEDLGERVKVIEGKNKVYEKLMQQNIHDIDQHSYKFTNLTGKVNDIEGDVNEISRRVDVNEMFMQKTIMENAQFSQNMNMLTQQLTVLTKSAQANSTSINANSKNIHQLEKLTESLTIDHVKQKAKVYDALSDIDRLTAKETNLENLRCTPFRDWTDHDIYFFIGSCSKRDVIEVKPILMQNAEFFKHQGIDGDFLYDFAKIKSRYKKKDSLGDADPDREGSGTTFGFRRKVYKAVNKLIDSLEKYRASVKIKNKEDKPYRPSPGGGTVRHNVFSISLFSKNCSVGSQHRSTQTRNAVTTFEGGIDEFDEDSFTERATAEGTQGSS